jgi:predicted permease
LGTNPAAILASFRQLHDAIAAVPGVQAVSLKIGSSPMAGDSEVPLWLDTEAKPASQQEMKSALFYSTQPDYLRIMKIPLQRGRFLTETDNEHAPFVTVIDERFAKKYFGDANPIGHHVHFEILDKTAEIVGVVGHVKQWGLDESSGGVSIEAQCYFSLTQTPDSLLPLMAHGIEGVARSEENVPANLSGITQALQSVNSQIVIYDTHTMLSIISDSLATQRFAMILLGIFAALATLLSCVGIYGVISYIVAQRTNEIGIRMALGAGRANVLRMVLRQAGRMALIGVATGLIIAFALTRLMASMLFGISAHDPLTFLGVALLLTLVALAACYIPARRATRVDPMVALRYE